MAPAPASTLTFEHAVLTQTVYDGNVTRHPEPHFLDFVVDGTSLGDLTAVDLVTELNRVWLRTYMRRCGACLVSERPRALTAIPLARRLRRVVPPGPAPTCGPSRDRQPQRTGQHLGCSANQCLPLDVMGCSCGPQFIPCPHPTEASRRVGRLPSAPMLEARQYWGGSGLCLTAGAGHPNMKGCSAVALEVERQLEGCDQADSSPGRLF
jgi:hypothetical protein